MTRYLIGVGSSHPRGAEYIQQAYYLLSQHPLVQLKSSADVITSPALGDQAIYAFSNTAFALTTSLMPDALWFLLRSIEHRLGRIRLFKNGPRTLDLDVLWSPWSIQTDFLTVPHPRLYERSFALNPAGKAAKKAQWPVHVSMHRPLF